VNAMGHHPVVLVHPEACTSCAKCARMCPDAALTVFARPREA
jgi:NAD-dependent dihydropyrimidine dehydrogenase PreA subunit